MSSVFHGVPVVVTQQSDNECGISCLAMILLYWGRDVCLDDLRSDLEPGRDGVSALALVRFARLKGLVASGEFVDETSLSGYSHPVILHWGGSHFVVLEAWDGRRGIIVDPAVGRTAVTRNIFSRYFGGVVVNVYGDGVVANGNPSL